MPPWPVAQGVRPLANDLNLTAREIEAFVSWADNGVRRGDPTDLPPPSDRPAWPAGPPSRVVSVLLEGKGPQQRVTLDSELVNGSLRIRGFDLKASAPGMVRAAFLYAQDKGGKERWLGAWTPWQAMTSAPLGAAAEKAGANSLVLELDLAPGAQGTVEVGLYLADAATPAALESFTVRASRNGERLRGRVVLERDLTVWAVSPSRKPIDGALEVSAVRADGSIEPLLWVLDQNSAWPAPYILEDPLSLKRGSAIVVTAHSRKSVTAEIDVLGFAAPQTPRP